MTSAKINENTLLHAIQCVAAMSRFMEEYVFNAEASSAEKETLGELVSDMDSVLDNLTTVYEQMRQQQPALPNSEELLEAYSQFTMQRKTSSS